MGFDILAVTLAWMNWQWTELTVYLVGNQWGFRPLLLHCWLVGVPADWKNMNISHFMPSKWSSSLNVVNQLTRCIMLMVLSRTKITKVSLCWALRDTTISSPLFWLWIYFSKRQHVDLTTFVPLSSEMLSANSQSLYLYRKVTFFTVCPSPGPISLPSIKVTASLINTSCSSVTVECFVENSRELILSWYRGRDRLNSTSSAVLSSTLSLALEIQSHDGDNYSCVAENPVEAKSTKFLTEDTCLKDGGMMMIKHGNTMLLFTLYILLTVIQ